MKLRLVVPSVLLALTLGACGGGNDDREGEVIGAGTELETVAERHQTSPSLYDRNLVSF